MAVSVSITLIQKTNITARISGLQYTASNYTFQFELTRTSTDELFSQKFNGTSTTNTYQDYNFGWLIPNNDYNVVVYVQYPKDTGTWYQYVYGSNPVTTHNIILPLGEYYPTYYPLIQSQSVYIDNDYQGEAGCCTACACATAMNISEYRERGTTNNNYSVAYIYGDRRLQSDDNGEGGMDFKLTLDQLQTDGSPQWDIVPINNTKDYPDVRFFEDSTEEVGAKTLYTTYEPVLRTQARLQKIGNIASVSFYDCETVSTYIQNNGFALIAMCLPDNFNGGNFATPEPGYNAMYDGAHAVCLIGWKLIDGKKCWICQNSWTTDWGDNGYFYLPMDWGIYSIHPPGWGSLNWVYDVRTFTGVTTTITRPSNFSWTNAKVSGQSFNLTADEWDAFTAKINEFRIYKGLSAHLFIRAISTNTFTATMFNEARNNLNNLSGYFGSGKSIPSTKNQYDPIMASYFNDMRDALNSIT